MDRRFLFAALTLLAAGIGTGVAQAASFCGDAKKNAFGPFDYRKAASLPQEYFLVTSAHFNSDVEQNIKGQSSYIAADLDYVLRAWPNHPAALASMSRQSILEKTYLPRGAHYAVDCYFLRAFEFAPTDGTPHAVYGNHLLNNGKEEAAMRQFKRAVELEPDNVVINYNAGLAFLRAKNYEKALFHAKKAYAQQFPLPGLKNKLIAAGKWDDTPLPAPSPEASPAKKPSPETPAAAPASVESKQ